MLIYELGRISPKEKETKECCENFHQLVFMMVMTGLLMIAARYFSSFSGLNLFVQVMGD